MRLRQRIAFTVGALIVYRFGTFIPLPGIELSAWGQMFRGQAGGNLGIFNIIPGGNRQTAIFALNIIPYLNAAIIIQFMALVSPTLRSLKDKGEASREVVDRYTRYLTVFLTTFSAYGVAIGLEAVPGLVRDPGWFFRLQTVVSLTGGTIFLVWLSDQITERGIGNGIALILTVGIVAELPSAIAITLELVRQGQGVLPGRVILTVTIIAVALVAFIVFMEAARRNIEVRYVRQDFGGLLVESISKPISVKLNSSGVIPLIFAPWLLLLPSTIANFNAGSGPEWLQLISHGRPLFLILYGGLIVVFTLIYVAFLFDPKQVSTTLMTRGGIIPGVFPGAPTAAYFKFVVLRITLVGGLYLAFVCIVPEVLISYYAVPFYLGGSALLIVVCTMMDIGAQFQQQARLEGGGQ